MKATFASDRSDGPVICIHFKESERSNAEKVGQWLIDTYGFEWIHEEDDLMTVGIVGYTIAELREYWKEAKEATK